MCVIIRHNPQRTISPLLSQRLSAPLIYIQSFLPPLSHVTVISPLSQVDDVCHHFDLSLTTIWVRKAFLNTIFSRKKEGSVKMGGGSEIANFGVS